MKGLVFKLLLPVVVIGGISVAAPSSQPQPFQSPNTVFDPSQYTGPLTVPPLTHDQRKAVMDYRRAQYKLRQQQKRKATSRRSSSQPAPATTQSTNGRAPASTSPATQADGRIEKWFEDLAAPEAEVRDRARLALLNLHSTDLPALREVLKRSGPASAAQATALRDIVIHLFLSGQNYETSSPEEGFLGVRLQPEPIGGLDLPQEDARQKNKTGVAVVQALPGFGAFGRLQSGDVVYGVDAPDWKPTPNMTELTKVISQVPPGQVIVLHLVRQGRRKTVSITLGIRPKVADNLTHPELTEQFMDERMEAAEQYWNEQFAALIGHDIS